MITYGIYFFFFTIGFITAYFILHHKFSKDVDHNIKTLDAITAHLSDKEYSLKNLSTQPTKTKLGGAIAKIQFKLIHRFDSEKNIIGMANLMLGQISQGNFDETIDIDCKYPLYNSLIIESNEMVKNLQQITFELDKSIAHLDSDFTPDSTQYDSLRDIISHKIEHLSNATVSYISRIAENDIKNGSSILDENISTINDIANIVSKISESVGAIQQISFQIEILALNASVEAASVGEVGKGFAVVANNLRDLVVHTTQASNDITNLVFQAKNKSTHTKETILQAKKSFNAIVDKITHTSF